MFNAIRKAVPHTAALRLFQVHAVTEGTDAQAKVSVRLEDGGHIATGLAADTDTLTASARGLRQRAQQPLRPPEGKESSAGRGGKRVLGFLSFCPAWGEGGTHGYAMGGTRAYGLAT